MLYESVTEGVTFHMVNAQPQEKEGGVSSQGQEAMAKESGAFILYFWKSLGSSKAQKYFHL